MLPRYRNDSDSRKYQINTLKVFNANVSEIQEDLEYQIAFTSGGNEFNLNVSLSSDFPKDKPIIKVSPTVAHPWVNEDGEVTSAPGLLNYTIHSDLGRVVQAIIREFERNPPPLINGHSSNNSPNKSITRDEKIPSSYSINFPVLNSFSPPSHMKLPTNFNQSVAFPELNKLSLEELKFLNENVDRQQEFLDETPQIKEQNKMLDNLLSTVEEIAESNLNLQEHLEELRTNIDGKIEEVTKLAFDNERLHVKYLSLAENYSPRNIQDQLSKAAQKAESEGEKIAESFLNGEMDVDKFVTLYTKTRKLCQTRKTTEEKLGQQLDRLEKAGY